MLSPLPPPPPPPPPGNTTAERDGSASSSPQQSSSLKRRAPLQARLSERGQVDLQDAASPSSGGGGSRNNSGSGQASGMAGQAQAQAQAYSLEASEENRPAGPGWWLAGLPCLALVFGYAGSGALLWASLGVLGVHALDVLGGSWAGLALAAQWLMLGGLAVQVGLAAHEHLMHSFALILVPITLLAYLGLVGIWGTLQYKWLNLEAPDLVVFSKGFLGVGTPLVCSPLIVWGGLACGLLEPSYAAFGLAVVMPLLVHWCALPSFSSSGEYAYSSGSSSSNGGRSSKPVMRRHSQQQQHLMYSGGTLWVGSAELKLLALATCLLPSLVHVVMHYQLLFGAYGGVTAAALAAVTQARKMGSRSYGGGSNSGGNPGGSLVHVGVLDDVALLVGWELVALLCGGFLAVVWLDAACRDRCGSGGDGSGGGGGTSATAAAAAYPGIGLPAIFGCPPTTAAATAKDSSSASSSLNNTTTNTDDDEDGADQKVRSGSSTRASTASSNSSSDFGGSTRLSVAAHVAAGLLVLALERRVALPFLQRWLVVGGAAGSLGLALCFWLVLSGCAVRRAYLGGDEWSAGGMQILTSLAALLFSHLVGLPWLLRPMAIAANLALTEFFLSRELAWYLVATAVAGGALWWWTSSTLGFLSEDSATVLPRLPWLPLLGGASDEWGNGTGASLPRLLASLLGLALLALLLPALAWGRDVPPSLLGAALTLHNVGLLLVEGLLGQLSARDQAAYPPLLVLATASAHVLAAYRLHFYAQGAAPKWSVGAALCLGASKLLTLCHFTPLAPSAAISLACFLLFAVALPWVHPPIIPPRSSLAHASSGGSSMSSGGSGGMSISNSSNGQDTNPLSAQTGFLLWIVGVAAIRNARTTVLAPLLDETFGYGSSSAVVVAPDGSSEAVVVSLREQCLEVALATLLAVILLARHFPHRMRLRRATFIALLAASLVFALDPSNRNTSDFAQEGSLLSHGRWALAIAAILVAAALLGALPGLGGGFSSSSSSTGGRNKIRLSSSSSSSSSAWGVVIWSSLLGALLGIWASDVIDAIPQSLEALVVAQMAALGASTGLLVSGLLVSGSSGSSSMNSKNNAVAMAACAFAGPLFAGALALLVAASVVLELATPLTLVPQGHAAAMAFFAASRLALAQLGAVAYTAVAASVFIATTAAQGTATLHGSSGSAGVSTAAAAAAAAVNPYIAQSSASAYGGGGSNLRGTRTPIKNVAMEFHDASVLVGNGACVVGWLLASYCASSSSSSPSSSSALSPTMDSFSSSGGSGGGLRSLATSLPLTLLLLLLRDDHGFLHGLSNGNRYAPPMVACQARLAGRTLCTIFMRGAPFLLTPASVAAARAAALAHKDLPPGLASTLAAKDNAWRAVSVWTAPSLLTGPLWELGLLLCVLPTHAAGLSFLWRHGGGGGSGASRSLAHARASFFALKRETLMAILPLNLAALVLSKQMGTQLLGLAGLGLGVWHLISLKYTERATQQRL